MKTELYHVFDIQNSSILIFRTFQTLWVERSTFETSSSLPGILRWFEVMSVTTENISPIQHACEMISNKNNELRQLTMTESQQQQSESPHPNNNLQSSSNVLKLTQSLQGVIDAAVNGGVAKYASAFFSPDFDDLASGQFVLQLHNLLMEQVNVLESALSVHERLVSKDIRPLHAHLVERFSQMKKSLPQQIKLPPSEFLASNISPVDAHFKTTPTKSLLRKTSIVHSPLPPVPSTSTKAPQSSLQSNHTASVS